MKLNKMQESKRGKDPNANALKVLIFDTALTVLPVTLVHLVTLDTPQKLAKDCLLQNRLFLNLHQIQLNPTLVTGVKILRFYAPLKLPEYLFLDSRPLISLELPLLVSTKPPITELLLPHLPLSLFRIDLNSSDPSLCNLIKIVLLRGRYREEKIDGRETVGIRLGGNRLRGKLGRGRKVGIDAMSGRIQA